MSAGTAGQGKMSVGRRIVQFRRELGLTQRQLAKRVGVQPPYLSQIETGKRQGTLKLLLSIAKELDTDVDTLAGEEPRESLARIAIQATVVDEKGTVVVSRYSTREGKEAARELLEADDDELEELEHYTNMYLPGSAADLDANRFFVMCKDSLSGPSPLLGPFHALLVDPEEEPCDGDLVLIRATADDGGSFLAHYQTIAGKVPAFRCLGPSPDTVVLANHHQLEGVVVEVRLYPRPEVLRSKVSQLIPT